MRAMKSQQQRMKYPFWGFVKHSFTRRTIALGGGSLPWISKWGSANVVVIGVFPRHLLPPRPLMIVGYTQVQQNPDEMFGGRWH